MSYNSHFRLPKHYTKEVIKNSPIVLVDRFKEFVILHKDSSHQYNRTEGNMHEYVHKFSVKLKIGMEWC